MLLKYIDTAMGKARYEILSDDNSYYGEIPEFQGVVANADSLEKCREQLREVLEEWVLLRIYKNLSLPVVDGVAITISEVA
ncbi:MAG: type II toxin-antitoxin system HicB family antitoxin [Chlorobi bacterium]|nr:type II toxin-antitoxin system HicB family antitoxin [Chlorobiota bacterium]